MKPRVFISYSWTSPGHQETVRRWAERLLEDGVEVVLDIWDLKEGDDTHKFMESMVTDPKVTHVLVLSDSRYAAKADLRAHGVGTESQIISKEVYAKSTESKFIPVVCEMDESGEPCLPVFIKNRKWVDFSSDEAVHKNWETLIRALFGKPLHQKPSVGSPPAYITTETLTAIGQGQTKLLALKQALARNRGGVASCRRAFLDCCYEQIDALRTRSQPDPKSFGQTVLETCGKLKTCRDDLVDWVTTEIGYEQIGKTSDSVIPMLEQLLNFKSKPPELGAWNDAWFEAHAVFAYETFLYTVAAILKHEDFHSLRSIFHHYYLTPDANSTAQGSFKRFDAFWAHSDALQVLSRPGHRLRAPAAELIKRQADRNDISFVDLQEAEGLAFLMTLITNKCYGWWPQTLQYTSSSRPLPFFLKATRRIDFQKLSIVTGIDRGEALRKVVEHGFQQAKSHGWATDPMSMDPLFESRLNLRQMDTLA